MISVTLRHTTNGAGGACTKAQTMGMSPADESSVKGNVVTLDLATTDFEVVKADGDSSGKTGHFHVFVDKDPSRYSGQPIPAGDPAIVHSSVAPIAPTGLTPGEHTIWIVLGNGNHVAFDPPVMDKLTVTGT